MDETSGSRAESRPTGAVETDGGVHFEETISRSENDLQGIGSRLAGGFALISVVGTVLFVPLSVLLFFGFVSYMSGRPMGDVVGTVVSDLPPDILLFIGLFCVVFVGGMLGTVVVGARMVRGGGQARDRVHTRVTDRGVEIDREGARVMGSAGLTVPFESVTAVEYSDPEGDPKVNLEDARAKKFIAGRSSDWVRIGRYDDPAVYVGSDRPRELADVVAGLAPNVAEAEPFS
ncbi:hypothetical protein BRD00_00945 [Halobacteriales archaeon QS_8_69_26]|nr:MAG: hypothetical protein BRD00_00945 [Halobacteriales archaeon QS_8_69_26]